MAARRLPEYLLGVMSQLGEESDSDDEFDGWVNDDDHAASLERSADVQETSPTLVRCRSHSVKSLDTGHEYPAQSRSPSHSPMQLETATHQLELTSPTPPSTSPSPPKFTADAGIIPNTVGMAPVDFFWLMFDDRVLDLLDPLWEGEYLQARPNARAHEWGKTELNQGGRSIPCPTHRHGCLWLSNSEVCNINMIGTKNWCWYLQ